MGYVGKSKRFFKRIGNYRIASQSLSAETSCNLFVSGVHTEAQYAPLALGMCMAYAKSCFEDESSISISTHFISNREELSDLLHNNEGKGSHKHVLLFSNYVWNREDNFRLSQLAKELDPNCITIHGGPDTPSKYAETCKEFLLSESHVDYVVAGEGEETLKELLECLSLNSCDNISVPGVRYMLQGEFINCGERQRATNLDKFPSPYLTGFFDDLKSSKFYCGIIESARGCPYSCAFCDWGSNTASKIKTFDFDRVISEINWFAEKKIKIIWLADANFGILKRDLEITKKICDTKETTGFPNQVVLTYSKNVKSRLIKIIDLMFDAGIQTQGIISLQTRDQTTLDTINRSNIKTSEYNKLHQAFVKRKYPYYVELMMALPGGTVESMKNDLAAYFDQPIDVFMHRSMLLTNSPMADPDYQRLHRITTDEAAGIISTATMSEAEVKEGCTICCVYQGAHRFGILRYLLRWLQWERGIKPLDVVQDLVRDGDLSIRFPLLDFLRRDAQVSDSRGSALVDSLRMYRDKLRQESSWQDLSDEFISWSSEKYAFAVDDTLLDLGRIQARLMPSIDRQFPDIIQMECNVVKWYADWLEGRGHDLTLYESASLQITDPDDLCRQSSLMQEIIPKSRFELESALSEIRNESLYKTSSLPPPSDEAAKKTITLMSASKVQAGAGAE